jgi:hypothetical protein
MYQSSNLNVIKRPGALDRPNRRTFASNNRVK